MIVPYKEKYLEVPSAWDGAEEYTEILMRADNWHLERIISRGHISPEGFWYEQEEDEWVMVLQGAGEISWEDGSRTILNMGEGVLIPKKCRHRVSMTTSEPECIWLALFFS